MMKSSPLPRDLLDRIDRTIKPQARYRCGETVISLYKARDVLSSKWNHPDLKKLLLICRKTYLRYGKRPLLDRYDSKAGIYLASVDYLITGSDSKNCLVREWLSVRLVPGNSKPRGVGEIEIFNLRGRSLDSVIKDQIFDGSNNFWDMIISSSRMCGLDPYFVNKDDAKDNSGLPKRHMHLAECFATIQWQFIRDGDLLCRYYLTEIIPSRLADKALVVKRRGLRLKPGSEPAYRFMKVRPDEIKADRGVYSYKFPAYWLNLPQLFELLGNLLREGYLSEKTFRYYLKTNLTFEEWTKNIFGPELPLLGKLTSAKGKIKWSKMTGPELRAMIDKRVQDEPELKITKIYAWVGAIAKIVQVLRIQLI